MVWIEIIASTFCEGCVSAFFFFFPLHFSWGTEVTVHALFSHFFIKNGSHGTIYTFKNYFATMFSVFNFHLSAKISCI